MMPRIGSKKTYRFSLDNFSGGLDQRFDAQCMASNKSPEAYNVNVEDGTLKRCKGYSLLKKYNPAGFAVLELPPIEGANKLFLISEDTGDVLYVSCEDGLYKEAYGLSDTVFEKVGNGGVDFMLSYYDGSKSWEIRGGAGSDTQFETQGESIVKTEPKYVKGLMFAERFFGACNRNGAGRICFSKQYVPYNMNAGIDEGGYIDVNAKYGKAVDMVVINNSIYNVWQYGITRLKAYGYQAEFELMECCNTSSEVKTESVQVCGNKIIFAQDDGIYSYDGSSLRKVSYPISLFISDGLEQVASGSNAGRYYIAFHSGRYPGQGNNVLLIYDVVNDKWNMFLIDVKCMASVKINGKQQMIFVGKDDRVWVFDDSESFGQDAIMSKWVIPAGTLGKSELIKEVRAVLLSGQGEGKIKITVKSERGAASKHITLRSSRRVYSLPIRVRGRLIGVEFENVDGNDFVLAEPTVLFTVSGTR